MATDVVKQIRKATRRTFSAEDKIRVVLEGLRGENPSRKYAAGIAHRVPFTTNGPKLFLMRARMD